MSRTTNIIQPLLLLAQHNEQVHTFDSEVDIMSLYIYRAVFRDKGLEPLTVLISGYGDWQTDS